MSNEALVGKVALVSGASRGIGAAAARQLADAGCALALVARDEAWLEMAAADVRQRGVEATSYAVDIADVEGVQSAIEEIESALGMIDIVVNAAGVVLPLDLASDADAEEWAYSVHVNLVGPFTIVNAVLPGMLEREYGRIVNLTCGASGSSSPGESAYRSAKAGLETWTGIVARELTDTGVSITCLDPGMVDTGLRMEAIETADANNLDMESWSVVAMQGQLRKPEDAAQLILWLVGPWSGTEWKPLYSVEDSTWLEKVRTDFEK